MSRVAFKLAQEAGMSYMQYTLNLTIPGIEHLCYLEDLESEEDKRERAREKKKKRKQRKDAEQRRKELRELGQSEDEEPEDLNQKAKERAAMEEEEEEKKATKRKFDAYAEHNQVARAQMKKLQAEQLAEHDKIMREKWAEEDNNNKKLLLSDEELEAHANKLISYLNSSHQWCRAIWPTVEPQTASSGIASRPHRGLLDWT